MPIDAQEDEYEEEVDETEIPDDEEYQGEYEADDEEIVDEIDDGEPDDDSEEPEGDEPDGEPDVIEVPFVDDNGQEMTVDVELDDLPELIQYHLKARDYIPKAQQWIESKKDFVKIGEYAINEPFLSHVVQMRLNGHPPQDIVAALFEYYQNSMNAQQEEELPLDENQRAYLQQMVNQQVAPLQQKLSQQEQAMHTRQVVEYNQNVIEETLEEIGYNFVPDDLPALQRAMQELYPGANTTTHQFTKRQIKAIVQESGVLNKKQAPNKQQRVVKALNKAKNAPRVAPGKQSSARPRNAGLNSSNTEEAQRSRLLAL